MQANVGDRLIVTGHHQGEPNRDADILEVRGLNGGPPYVVRWSDTGDETFFFPGPATVVQHFEAEPA